MDSSLTKPMPVKRLAELLQEQQEPFCLDEYLVERGYLRGASLCRRKRSLPCPRILKKVLRKLVPTKDALKTASSCQGRTIRDRMSSGKARCIEEEPVRFSSASSMTLYDSHSESDMEEEFPSHQQDHISSSLREQGGAIIDRTQLCGCLEDSKQHSPVSVLEELHSDGGSPFYNHMKCCPRSNETEIPSTFTNRITEESLLSASLWDLLQHSPFQNQGSTGLREVFGHASSSQYRKTKRAIEQTKQLLFDSVRQVLEIQGKNVLRGEQMGKMICQQICFWSKQSGNVTNITQLLFSDFSEATEKWNDTQPQTREIEIQISNAILEELELEIVSDLIASVSR